MKIEKNTLFYGDNLEILRDYVADDFIDLIYLDPPFKKQKRYNVLYPEPNGSPSEAQTMAYADTWFWNETCEKIYNELIEQTPTKLAETIKGIRDFLHESDTMAYLVNMAIRLRELRRVLKSTGSIYLHCDATAGHYLKIIMDSIFGEDNFQNEVIWYYTGAGVSKKRFAPRHDNILFYTKTNKWSFYPDRIRIEYAEATKERFKYYIGNVRGDKNYGEQSLHAKGKYPDDVLKISIVAPSSKKRLGYPTQKPEALLERIILASSDKDSWVLDPFCGCGTTIAVAEKLNRRWIGIDITHIAINLMKYRLYDSFGKTDYEVIGEPKDLHGAIALAKQDKYQFQYWALGLVNARPLGHTKEGRKGADRGIDGIKYVADRKGNVTKIIIQVKGGHVNPSQIRDLKGTVNREKAQMGAFITLEKPTKEMMKEAASAGFYHSDNWNKDYPRIQILTIEEILKKGKTLKHHPAVGVTFKKAPKVKRESEQLKIQ